MSYAFYRIIIFETSETKLTCNAPRPFARVGAAPPIKST